MEIWLASTDFWPALETLLIWFYLVWRNIYILVQKWSQGTFHKDEIVQELFK